MSTQKFDLINKKCDWVVTSFVTSIALWCKDFEKSGATCF